MAVLPGGPSWDSSPSLPARLFPGSHSACEWGTLGNQPQLLAAVLGPSSWLGTTQGHHVVTAQPQIHARIFQYQ